MIEKPAHREGIRSDLLVEGRMTLPRVAILLAVHNGERFLWEQIASLASQSWPEIDVWASDDGSTDGSAAILLRAATGWRKGSFRTLKGPGNGFAENFRSLITNPEIHADTYAFCDQDDVWMADKLQTAIGWLGQQDAARPCVFCSRTRITNSAGEAIGLSPLFSKPPAFRNAIVQSIAGGNTMVMNQSARKILAEASRRTGFVTHDWWTYMVITGAGGTVHYAATPLVNYRQHGANMVGENNSWRARWMRIRLMRAGRFSEWSAFNLAALRACDDLLSPDAREVVGRFAAARSGSLSRRIAALVRSGAYRQTKFGQIGLWVACLLGKL